MSELARKRAREEQTIATSSSSPSPPKNNQPLRLERSIFGFTEVEGMLRRVFDFLFFYAGTPNVEVRRGHPNQASPYPPPPPLLSFDDQKAPLLLRSK